MIRRASDSSATDARPSEARQRLLATATRIFYGEGIHSVGVDRIIAEAQVTRATFYRHYPGKEDLVLAYLQATDQAIRAQAGAVAEAGLSGAVALRAVAGAIAESIRSEGFRGCAFLNAVAEYPNPAHPVHQAVLDHRRWFLDTVTALMGDVPGVEAEPAAQHFVMLRDGAMAAGCLFDKGSICATFLRGVEGLLQHGAPPAPPLL